MSFMSSKSFMYVIHVVASSMRITGGGKWCASQAAASAHQWRRADLWHLDIITRILCSIAWISTPGYHRLDTMPSLFSLSLSVYIHISVYIYIYVYIHVYIYVYIYIYVCMLYSVGLILTANCHEFSLLMCMGRIRKSAAFKHRKRCGQSVCDRSV